LKCRVALLTSLYSARLKVWEAIETIHLGIAGISKSAALIILLPFEMIGVERKCC
jgi:hypothetical protein